MIKKSVLILVCGIFLSGIEIYKNDNFWRKEYDRCQKDFDDLGKNGFGKIADDCAKKTDAKFSNDVDLDIVNEVVNATINDIPKLKKKIEILEQVSSDLNTVEDARRLCNKQIQRLRSKIQELSLDKKVK